MDYNANFYTILINIQYKKPQSCNNDAATHQRDQEQPGIRRNNISA